MLPSGVRSIFVAHSLVDPRQARRITALAEQLDDFRLAVTSEAHAGTVSSRSLAPPGEKLSVMMAIDTGLGREGVRDSAAAARLAAALGRSIVIWSCAASTLTRVIFTALPREQIATRVEEMLQFLCAMRDSHRSVSRFGPAAVSARA